MDPETFFRRAKEAWRALTKPAPEGTKNEQGMLVMFAGRPGLDDCAPEPPAGEPLTVLQKSAPRPVQIASSSILAGEYVLTQDKMQRFKDDKLLAEWLVRDQFKAWKDYESLRNKY